MKICHCAVLLANMQCLIYRLYWKEGNVLFNDAHFVMVIWCQTYGKGLFRWQEKKPTGAITWAIIFDEQQGIFFMGTIPNRIVHTTAFGTPVVEHCLEWEMA